MSGQIELPSGIWTWHRLNLMDCSTQELERVVIALKLEGTPNSRMRLELEPFEGEVDPSLIAELAHDPRSRDVDVDGEPWEIFTRSRPGFALGVGRELPPEPYQVIYHSRLSPPGMGQLPPGVGLGDVTDDQLRDIIRRGSAD